LGDAGVGVRSTVILRTYNHTMQPLPEGSQELARLHQRWEELHTKLRAHEQILSDAVALYARGQGPRPDAIMKEVQAMRAECSGRFRKMMDAAREQD
jgi:hypothetical protein